MFFAFVFWKLDRRNRELIKNSEAALRYFESLCEVKDDGEQPSVVKIFTREEYETSKKRARNSRWFRKNHYSYSDCLNLVFVAFGLIGILGLVLALIRSL